ncbi:MAG: SlyX family protein [Pikeienuella sp.]
MTSDRIDTLETHIAHQEAAIEDLSETVQAQWLEIDALKRAVGKLNRTLEAMAMAAGDDDTPPADQPPPHY